MIMCSEFQKKTTPKNSNFLPKHFAPQILFFFRIHPPTTNCALSGLFKIIGLNMHQQINKYQVFFRNHRTSVSPPSPLLIPVFRVLMADQQETGLLPLPVWPPRMKPNKKKERPPKKHIPVKPCPYFSLSMKMPMLFASGKVVAGGVAFVARILQKEQKRLPHSLSPGCDYAVDFTPYLFSRSPSHPGTWQAQPKSCQGGVGARALSLLE